MHVSHIMPEGQQWYYVHDPDTVNSEEEVYQQASETPLSNARLVGLQSGTLQSQGLGQLSLSGRHTP